MDKFKELWANPRYKAIMKLGLWFIFLLIIIIASTFSSSNKEQVLNNNDIQKEEVNFPSLIDLENKLFNTKVKYTYKVNSFVDNDTIIYNGEINEEIDTGYYESKTEIYKFSCTLEKCYKLFTDHQEEYLIDNYPLKFIKNTFETVNNLKSTEHINESVKTYTYITNVQEEDWKIEIKTNLTDITSIKLTTPKELYEISFEY